MRKLKVLSVGFHWPHDRFALGWETIGPTEEQNVHTYSMFLLFMTITLDIYYYESKENN